MPLLFFPTATEKNSLPGPGLEPELPALRTETLALSHRSLHGTELVLLLLWRPFPPGKKKLDQTGIEPEPPSPDLRALTIEPIHLSCRYVGTSSSRRSITSSAQLPIVACSLIHDFFRTSSPFFSIWHLFSFLAHTPGVSTGPVFMLFPATSPVSHISAALRHRDAKSLANLNGPIQDVPFLVNLTRVQVTLLFRFFVV